MVKKTQPIEMKSVYNASPKVITREIEGELIIVPIEGGIADFDSALYSLNETGRAVWDLLKENRSVENICAILSEEYSAASNAIKNDVLLLLKELMDRGIIVESF